MALKTRVLVREVSNLHDARYCAGMGVEMISFSLDVSHPKYTDADRFKEIAGWLAGMQFMGELQESAEVDLQAYEAIDALMTRNTSLLPQLKAKGLPVYLQIHGQDIAQIEDICQQHAADAYVLTGQAPQDLEALKALAGRFPLFLGFEQADLPALLEQVQPEGLCLTGGEEIKVGLNDFDALAEVLEALEEEE